VGLFRPSASASHLLGLVRTRLDGASLSAPVAAVEVEVTLAAPLALGQQTLFGDSSPEDDSRELAALVDRLSSRLGRKAVVRPRWRSEAQPELACQYEPLTGGTSAGQRRRGSTRNRPEELPPRPLRLLRRPLALDVVSLMQDGLPARFRLDGKEHRLAWTWGPERIKTGWWRGRAIGRDYYRIETTQGNRYWLFRRLRDGKWFLHGLFE
jgi:protein ImuB